MVEDVAQAAAELLARFGAGADEEARRRLDAACLDDLNHEAQHWISVVFFLARARPRLAANG